MSWLASDGEDADDAEDDADEEDDEEFGNSPAPPPPPFPPPPFDQTVLNSLNPEVTLSMISCLLSSQSDLEMSSSFSGIGCPSN